MSSISSFQDPIKRSPSSGSGSSGFFEPPTPTSLRSSRSSSSLGSVASKVNLENKQEALDHIRNSAQKVTTVVMGKKDMEDYWGVAVQLPAMTQIVTAPYRLVCYIDTCIKDRTVPSLEVSSVKVVSDTAMLANTAAVLCLYIAKYLVSFVSITVLLPFILVTGLAISVLEGGVEGYRLCHQNKFLKQFGVETFAYIDLIKEHYSRIKDRSDHTSIAFGVKMLHTLKESISLDTGITPQLKEEILRAIEELVSKYSSANFNDIKAIGALLEKTEKDLVLDRFKQLEEKYFKLTGEEVDSVMKKVEAHFGGQELDTQRSTSALSRLAELCGDASSDMQSVDSTFDESGLKTVQYDVDRGLHLVEKEFEKKQLRLAGRVQPWLAEKIAKSHQALIKDLEVRKPDAVKEARELLTRIDFNARLKAEVHSDNLKLWIMTAVSFVLTYLFPKLSIVSMISFLISVAGSTLNNIMVETRLNNEDSMSEYKWRNLLPEFVRNRLYRENVDHGIYLNSRLNADLVKEIKGIIPPEHSAFAAYHASVDQGAPVDAHMGDIARTRQAPYYDQPLSSNVR